MKPCSNSYYPKEDWTHHAVSLKFHHTPTHVAETPSPSNYTISLNSPPKISISFDNTPLKHQGSFRNSCINLDEFYTSFQTPSPSYYNVKLDLVQETVPSANLSLRRCEVKDSRWEYPSPVEYQPPTRPGTVSCNESPKISLKSRPDTAQGTF